MWQRFIKKVDPEWESKKYVPKNPQKWFEVYCKHKREAEDKLRQDENDLRQRMMGLNKHKAAHTSVVVDAKHLPRLPRDPRMRPNNGGVPIGKNGKSHQRSRNDSVLTWGSGSKTKTSDSRGVLLRAKREAKEMSMRGKLGVPANQLKSRSVVLQAPASMVDGYRRAAHAPLKIYTSSKKTSSDSTTSKVDAAQEARERRLRALTMGKNQGVQRSETTRQGVSEDDGSSEERPERNKPTRTAEPMVVVDDDDSEVDDIFDEKPSLPKKSANPRQVLPPPKPRTNTNALLSSSYNKSSANPGLRSTPSHTPPTGSTKSANPTGKSMKLGAQRSDSPSVSAGAGAPKPLIRKRAEVDVFNRQPKRPRR